MNRVMLSDDEAHVLLVTHDHFQHQPDDEYNQGDGSKFQTPTPTGVRPAITPAKAKRNNKIQQVRKKLKDVGRWTLAHEEEQANKTPATAGGSSTAKTLEAPLASAAAEAAAGATASPPASAKSSQPSKRADGRSPASHYHCPKSGQLPNMINPASSAPLDAVTTQRGLQATNAIIDTFFQRYPHISRRATPVLHMVLHGLLFRWDVHMLDFDERDRVSSGGHVIPGARMSIILRQLLHFLPRPDRQKPVPGQEQVLRAILALNSLKINQHLIPFNMAQHQLHKP